jgi:hypothetical protein
MTYTSLLSDLRTYLERGTVSDVQVYNQLPSLINLAERDLATKLKILGNKNVVTSTMVAGTSVYAKPDRWRETTSFNFGVGTSPNQQRTPMYPRSYEYCRFYWPNSETQGVPQFYADYSYQNWLIVPTPNSAYPFEVSYWQLLPLLDSANQQNFWTDYAPQALLYGALLQCTSYLKNDERIPTWGSLYADQLKSLGAQDLQGQIDSSDKRKET